ncbi:MAG: formate dehydrogenase subunit delta [Sphingomonadales bacterium]
MNTHERLVYMANQIGRNFAVMGDVDAAAATADHIATYWDPRMKAAIQADASGLEAIAAAAIQILARDGHPSHQTRATKPDHGSNGSDAS